MKNEILLKSKKYLVTQILKKTKAVMFKNLLVGNQVEFSVPLKYAGIGRSGIHATYITATNLSTGEQTTASFNQMPTLLKNFVLSEQE